MSELSKMPILFPINTFLIVLPTVQPVLFYPPPTPPSPPSSQCNLCFVMQ